MRTREGALLVSLRGAVTVLYKKSCDTGNAHVAMLPDKRVPEKYSLAMFILLDCYK